MQAYANSEMAPAAELRFFDRRPTSLAGASGQATAGAVVLDELLGQLADLVADRLAARLEAPQVDDADDWLDTRRGRSTSESIETACGAWLLSERSRRSRQARVASCSSGGRIWTHGAVLERQRWLVSGAGTMSETNPAPRRVRVERAIYRRPTGVLEVCFKDESGRLRWRTVEGGVLAARKLRDDLAARRARG